MTLSQELTVAYRGGDHVAGIVAVNAPPKELRAWRAAIAARQAWSAAVDEQARKRMQYRSDIIEGFLAGTGPDLAPP